MRSIILHLKDRLSFLESGTFESIAWFAALALPFPLWFQMIQAFFSQSAEGLLFEAYTPLALCHLIMFLVGIKTVNEKMVLTFLITTPAATGTAVCAWFKGTSWIQDGFEAFKDLLL